MTTNSLKRNRLLAGLVAGILAGLIYNGLVTSPLGFAANFAFCVGLGLLFAYLWGDKVQSAGGGFVWGEAFGLLWWLLGPLTLLPLAQGQAVLWTAEALQTNFAELPGWVSFGAALGLIYYWLAGGNKAPAPLTASATPAPRNPRGQDVLPPRVQALIVGGVAGLLGSWLFALGIERGRFYPLVAQIARSDSPAVGRVVHYIIGAVIGISFALLFYREIKRPGVGLAWGLHYGLFWWFLGPLTLLPLLLGTGWPDWTLTNVRLFTPSLVAHLLYGALVGWLCGLGNRLWQLLFVDSDPINRTAEGGGVQTLRNLIMGALGGVIGGLLFTVIMLGIGALPVVASLVGGSSPLLGLIVHLIISMIIGITYGWLYQKEAPTYGAGLAWGVLYGFFWWVLGALTLFNLILRQPVDWSLPFVVARYPSLVGHLLYGAALGLFFHYLARRYALLRHKDNPQDTNINGRSAQASLPKPGEATPLPALWAVTLVLAVLIPLLLALNAGSGGTGY